MAIVVDILLLLVGFVLLVKASDIFVDAVSSIATNFKMSKMMIALTVAAFGTCAPELAISFNSMSSGSGDIALANVLGSNIVNILLIVGIAALVKPINVKHEVIKKELPILLVVTSMFTLSILALPGIIALLKERAFSVSALTHEIKPVLFAYSN